MEDLGYAERPVSDESSSSDRQEDANNNDDSGYNSDSGLNSTSEETTSDASETDPPFSTSSDYSGSDFDEDVDAKIEYLREKQSVLKRASHVFMREAAFNAANAFAESDAGPSQHEGDAHEAIWNEARVYLKDNNPLADVIALGRTKVKSPTRCIGSPKDPSIDFSNVERRTKLDDEESEVKSASVSSALQLLSSVNMFRQGQWMAQALVWSIQENRESDFRDRRSPNQQEWRVISDPQTCALGLVPPSNSAMRNSITLQEAVSITSEARLVAQSTPPFCVVYANRALLLMANLQSSTSIIGKPIESALQVVQDFSGDNNRNPDGGEAYLDSVLLASTSHKACRIRVIPVVVDENKRRKMADSTFTNSPSSYMSHVMVPVLERPRELPLPQRRQRAITITVIEDDYECRTPDKNSVFGTVG